MAILECVGKAFATIKLFIVLLISALLLYESVLLSLNILVQQHTCAPIVSVLRWREGLDSKDVNDRLDDEDVCPPWC